MEYQTRCSSLGDTSCTSRVTLIDMDHYVKGTFDPHSQWVVTRAYEMHEHIIETFRDHVVTREAAEEWK